MESDDDEEDGGAKKPLTTTFELNDTLFAEAELEETDEVHLWLGVCLVSSTVLSSPNIYTTPLRS